MASITVLNPKAELARSYEALGINVSAAKGLLEVMKSNLGPKGTMKMLVSGAGDIKLTKDGNTLLHEMQIKNPTTSFIARASTAVDDINGDGTTSTVLMIGELLKQSEFYIIEGLHPRTLTEGFDHARKKVLAVLEDIKINVNINDREKLLDVARTSLYTKVNHSVAKILTDICVEAVLTVAKDDVTNLDLNMIEIMEMKHRCETETALIKGLVLDHGSRHSEMPTKVNNAYILTCNVSMEYEKSEVNSGFFYKTSEEREKLLDAERDFINQRVNKVIELKKKLCDGTDKNFVVINQKGIDNLSLEMFAKENIIAIRRAKSRNMERLTLACGGMAMNTVDELSEEQLGYAGSVYEHILGEDKFTFIEECKNPSSVTILIKGPTKYALMQIKDALRDGLRAVKNTIQDKCLVPGAGAFELLAFKELNKFKESVPGKSKLGIQAYAEALLIIPKVLAMNSGLDVQDTIVKLLDDSTTELGLPVGIDVNTGETLKPVDAGIYDNYQIKKQIINSATVIASNLLLVDEIMRAGLSSLKG